MLRVENKTIIEAIRDYFNRCPYLDEQARLNIDFLGNDKIEYGIYTEPGETFIKRYTDGEELKAYNFIFTTRTPMSGDFVVQLENSAFFERLTDWIEERNRQRDYPKLSGKRKAQKLEIVSNGYVTSADSDECVYQIGMKLIYLERM